jgi:lysyl-tRNA synthetase class II
MEAYKTYQDYTYWIDLFKCIYDSLTYFVDKQSSSSKWVEMKMIDFVSSYVPTTHETLVKDFDKLMDDPEVVAKYPYLIITHHPTYDSPLAKPADNLYAERAEVFISGMEVANMYTENVDPILQRKVFEEQIANKDNHMGIDEDFIHALELGCPPCSGIGIGVDRIVMQLFRLIDIRDVIMFPAYRTK